jgi:multidrug efflux pump subunit AcrA (membrane-fusion protein)
VYVTNRSGEKKRVGDTVWRRDKVLAIPDLSEMAAEGRVEESDSGRIAEGQRVELRLDAYPEVTFAGTVRKIGKTVLPRTRNSPIRVVHVHVELDETDVTRMRPDMRFRGEVEIERAPNVLQIPLAAVVRVGSRAVVYRGTWRGTREVDVELGRSNDEYVEVLAGLGEGDSVAVEGRAH